VVVVHDHAGTTVVLGEAKARQDIDVETIDKLHELQLKLSASHVRAVVAIANSKSSLSTEEVVALRRLAERPLPAGWGREGVIYEMPLVLTKRTLTRAVLLGGLHPLFEGDYMRPRIDQALEKTAMEELGLCEGWIPDRPPKWTDPGPTR